jgi:carbamoyltransferase
MIVLGYHGSLDGWLTRSRAGHGAAAIVVDGEVIAACEDGGFARVTRTASVPEPAIGYVLRQAGLKSLDEVDRVAHAHASDAIAPRDLLDATRDRVGPIARTALALGIGAFRRLDRAGGGAGLRCRRALRRRTGIALDEARFVSVAPHVANLASAFFTSPFDRALVVAIGNGLDATTLGAGVGRGTRVEVIDRTLLPNSLVHLRAAIARHLGVDEITLPTLAAKGDPTAHRRFFRSLIHLDRDAIADVSSGLVLDTLARRAIGAGSPIALVRALGPARGPEEALAEHHADVAAALEEAITLAVLASLQALRLRTGERDLCLSGSLALDASINGHVARSGIFDHVHVPAAPHAPGSAIGAALYVEHHLEGLARARSALASAYLGPEADDSLVQRSIAIFAQDVVARAPEDLASEVARSIARGDVVAWVQGRAACAAGALGSRSLLADPRRLQSIERLCESAGTGDTTPLTVLVPTELAQEWIDLDGIDDARGALFEVPARSGKRRELAALGSRLRVQTVDVERAPRLHALLHAFGDRTGVPILVETELRVAGAPVAHGPEDAIEALLASPFDLLVLGDRVVERREQPEVAERGLATPAFAAA